MNNIWRLMLAGTMAAVLGLSCARALPGAPSAGLPDAVLDQPVVLALNAPVAIAPQSQTPSGDPSEIATPLILEFRQVNQDSRCPETVTCVWPGQARVVLTLHQGEEDLGEVELVLQPGNAAAAVETLGGYTMQLTELAPYPQVTGAIAPDDYQATVVVSQSTMP